MLKLLSVGIQLLYTYSHCSFYIFASVIMSRVSRKSTPVPQTPQEPSTSRRARDRSESPVSPTRRSRIQEKFELQNLNDRLACYIERVRQLEVENKNLLDKVQNSEEIRTREVTQVKYLYDNEVNTLRKSLDDEAGKRVRLDVENKKLADEKKTYKTQIDKLNNDLKRTENELTTLQKAINELRERNDHLSTENKKLIPDNEHLRKENDRLTKELKKIKDAAEQETIQRISLENQIVNTREQAAFAQAMLEKQLTEVRTTRSLDLSDVDARVSQKYEEKYSKELQELREQYQQELKFNREELSKLYEDKLKALENENARNAKMAMDSYNLQKKLEKDLDQLRKDIQNRDDKVKQLEFANNDLERKMQQEKLLHSSQMNQIQDTINKHLKEYEALMDTKVALDLEIAAYRKLLEGEEKRLNYTPTTPNRSNSFESDTTDSGLKGMKRKRGLYEDDSSIEIVTTKTANSDVEIEHCDPEGAFIRLVNKGNKEASLGSWQIVRTVGDQIVSFKLHHSVKVEPQGTVTVWSLGARYDHEPPHNIVMKTQKWIVGDEMNTVVLNNKGEEMATFKQRKEQRTRVYRQIYNNGVRDDETCVVM